MTTPAESHRASHWRARSPRRASRTRRIGRDRAERLLGHELHLRRTSIEHARLDLRAEPPAAGQQARARGDRRPRSASRRRSPPASSISVPTSVRSSSGSPTTAQAARSTTAWASSSRERVSDDHALDRRATLPAVGEGAGDGELGRRARCRRRRARAAGRCRRARAPRGGSRAARRSACRRRRCR